MTIDRACFELGIGYDDDMGEAARKQTDRQRQGADRYLDVVRHKNLLSVADLASMPTQTLSELLRAENPHLIVAPATLKNAVKDYVARYGG